MFSRGKLKTNGQDLSVDGYSAPLARGWESSSRDNAERNGLYFENTTALVVGNEVIRGGGGGYAIYASNSSVSIYDNDWVAGGKGLYGGGTSSKSSSGGHGILARNSSLFISNTSVRGGDGSDSSTQKLEGGDGGIGIEVENVTLEILNSSVIGGSGRRGVLTNGLDGMGLQLRSSHDAFLDSSSISGRTAFLVSDSSIYVRNSIVASEQYDFDLGNASSAISMNTTFDKSSVIFQDTMSTLTVGWHLHALVLDVLSLPVPRTELKIWPATYTTQGELYLGSSISGPASPTIAYLGSPTDPDLLIGDMNGNIQFYIWNGSHFLYNGTVNLSAGGPVTVYGPCSPHFADWEGDGDLDLFLGNESGLVFLFNNTGDGTFDMGSPLNLTGGAPINTSSEVDPFIVDWDGDGELDVIAGGDGYIYYFKNDGNGYFLPGQRLKADGSEIKHGSWSSPEVLDFDGDGRLDLLVGSEEGSVALYLNDSFDQLAFGGYLKSNNSILHNIDAGVRSVPTTADLDGDGYPDLLAGNQYGEVKWFSSNRFAGEVVTYTDDGGGAANTPVIEYIQMDSNGDNDGEDDGERFYLSPSGMSASRCGMTGNVAPLPHMTGSLSVTVHLNVDLGNCPPVVQSTDPFQHQDNVPVKSGIIIVFDKDMNKTVVEGSLFFNPSLTISTSWPTSSKIVLDVGTMNFGENYTLTISGSAQDLLGRGLDGNFNGASEGSPDDDFKLMFRTEEIPQVISHNPDGSGQPVNSIISLCFNKAMNASSVEQFLSLSPAVDFWAWWNTYGSCIYLDAELEPGTTYTVSVSGD
ncbi:MAG: VCBS repeat-containing protein, partial [Thermoplasmata archaeon]|nr:VCBS repeat-containing protein [Thermoplasmata archaeon]